MSELANIYRNLRIWAKMKRKGRKVKVNFEKHTQISKNISKLRKSVEKGEKALKRSQKQQKGEKVSELAKKH